MKIMNNIQKIWFVAKDIGEMLGLKNIKKNVLELPNEVTSSYLILDTLGRVQNTTIVSEGGLYRLVFKSRKPGARNSWHRVGHF